VFAIFQQDRDSRSNKSKDATLEIAAKAIRENHAMLQKLDEIEERVMRIKAEMERAGELSASDSNAKGTGFETRQGQGFSSSYETPEILGAGDSNVLQLRR
jgi:hypothetical protein